LFINPLVSLPRGNNQFDTFELIVGTLALNIQNIDVKNVYRKFKLITGPGVTIRGESLYESDAKEDKNIDLECII